MGTMSKNEVMNECGLRLEVSVLVESVSEATRSAFAFELGSQIRSPPFTKNLD